MSEKTSKKARKFIIAAIVIVAAAVAAFVICYFIFRDREQKLVYKTLNEVLAEAPDVLDNEYDNIKLSDGISFDDAPKELYTFTSNIASPLEEAKQYVADLSNRANPFQITTDDLEVSLYSDEQYLDSAYLEVRDIDSKIPCDPSEYTEEQYYVSGGNSEAFMIVCPYLAAAYGYGINEKCYEIGKDDISDVSYNVYGEQYTAQQAIDYTDSVVEKFKDLLLPKLDGAQMKPRYIIAAKNENPGEHQDEYSYIVQYACYYEDIEINMGGEQSFSAEQGFIYPRQIVEIAVTKPGRFSVITKSIQTQDMKATKLEDKYVTLESALDRVSHILAPEFIHTITDIDIVYVPREEYFKNEAQNMEPIEPEPEVTFRPMWRLTTDLDHSNENFMPCGRYIYIDMVTGEFVIYDEAKANHALTEKMIKEEKQDPTFTNWK